MIGAERLAARENAVAQERHWVRLTRCCNNHCRFCLDQDAQDGSVLAMSEVRAELKRGIERGRHRVVLSGGEPTIHPHFIEIVGEARSLGYQWIQVVTNGRMLARKDFLEACLDAGLSELTFSIHGHEAALHDSLTEVPGSFAQALRALTLTLRDGRTVVSVDIVACRQNVRHLDTIVAVCARLGVTEFDILHVQPAGRAALQPESMLYDLAEEHKALSRVFDLSKRPELFLWANRFPPDALEGHEDLIQDPKKLIDEVRGRVEMTTKLFNRGESFFCRDLEGPRCGSCYLSPLCDELHEVARRLRDGLPFPEARVDLREEIPTGALDRRWGVTAERTRVIARRAKDALGLDDGSLPGREVALWLDESDGIEALGDALIAGLPLRRIASESVAVLDGALGLGIDELEVAPAKDNAGWLDETARAIQDSTTDLVIRPLGRARASEHLDRDVEPRALAQKLSDLSGRCENMPPCLCGGRATRATELAIDLRSLLLWPDLIDAEALTRAFAMERFRSKSRRCRRCAFDDTCKGATVGQLRAFGFAILEPQ